MKILKQTHFMTSNYVHLFLIFISTLFLAIFSVESDYESVTAQTPGKIEIIKNTIIQNATDPGLAINSNTNNLCCIP